MDADVIFSKQLKQIEKEKRDKEIKLKAQEKKVICSIKTRMVLLVTTYWFVGGLFRACKAHGRVGATQAAVREAERGRQAVS